MAIGSRRVVGLLAVSWRCARRAAARAAETITIGLVGTASATHWPIYAGLKQGYYDAADIKLDMIFTPSSGALVQQLAAGSLDAALSTGIVDPIYAIDKGAPIAIVRLEVQSPPYALIAKPSIKSIKDLKGKTIMIDGPKGITKIYVERMLAKNGVKPNEFDALYAGATAARFAALQSGAIDATVLLPPFNFYAETAGFANLGLTIDYTPELPFSGAVVNTNWAAKNRALLDRLARRAQQEHGLVPGYEEPRRGDHGHGRGQQAEARRHRQRLRLPAEAQVLRGHRQGLADAR